jgi:hypothetical protein
VTAAGGEHISPHLCAQPNRAAAEKGVARYARDLAPQCVGDCNHGSGIGGGISICTSAARKGVPATLLFVSKQAKCIKAWWAGCSAAVLMAGAHPALVRQDHTAALGHPKATALRGTCLSRGRQRGQIPGQQAPKALAQRVPPSTGRRGLRAGCTPHP